MNLKKIIDLIEEKKFEKGLIEVQKLLNIEESVELLNLLGIILNAQNKTDKALDVFNKALEKDKKNIPIYKNKISILLKENKDDELIECYQNLIKIDKNNVSYYNNLAIIFDRNNKKELALKTINKAIDINSKSEISYINKATILFDKNNKETYEKSKKPLFKALEINPNNLNALFVLGKIFYEIEEYDISIKYLNSYIALDNKNAQTHYIKGECFYKKNNFNDALESFKEVLKINPNHIDTINTMGRIYNSLDKNNDAIEMFERTISIVMSRKVDQNTKQDLSMAYYNLGLCNRDNNNIQKAELFLKKSIELLPNFVNAQSQLAAIKLIQTNDTNDDITININYALDDNKENSDNLNEKNIIIEIKNCLNKKQFKDAEKKCRKLINDNNRINDKLYYLLAQSLFAQFKIEKALTNVEKAIKLNHKLVDAYRLKATLLSRLKRDNEAINVCKQITNIDKKDVKTLNQLAFIYKKIDQKNNSKKVFKKVLEIDPNNSHAQSGLSMLENSSLTNDEIAIQESYKSLKMIGDDYANQKSHRLSSIRHDIEQAKYLLNQGFKDSRIVDFVGNGETFLNYLRFENKNNDESIHQAIMDKPINEIKNILQKYWSLPIIYNTKEIKNFLNPSNNWKNIQEQYIESKPEFVVIDNFLSEEALIELRKFCLLSKVFLKEYENDYLGAFGNMGFTSSIHMGIGRDLKIKMSKIFGEQSLNHMWAFKYDSKIGSGINVHADFAKVNLNFWITPDEYNLNEQSGGLKVYDTPPPEDWVFEKYNASQKDIYKFLKSVNAGYMSAHYKCNRAVLFNSSLFHETEKINFIDKYEGRRINVTYLFGRK